MKKIISTILVIAFTMCLTIPTNAADVYFHAANEPIIFNTITTKTTNDVTYSLTFDSDAKLAETLRLTIYESFLKDYTHEQIASSTSAWILSETKNICQISINNSKWVSVKALSADSDEFSLSFLQDILPSIKAAGINLERLTNGFSFSLRIITASENYTDGYTGKVFVCTEGSGIVFFTAPSFGYVNYILADGAINSALNPDFFLTPLNNDIPLYPAVRQGYIFDGWSKIRDYRIGVIKAGTVSVKLMSNWLPKTYAINYVLTTNNNYPFGRADNLKNPTTYACGKGAMLYDIISPVGGFTFDGWYLSPDFSGDKITNISADFIGDVILYAKWLSDEEKEDNKRKEKENYIKEYGYGDVNNDGIVSSADSRLILRAVVQLEDIPYEMLKRVDYYNSGFITAESARITLRVAVGIDTLYDILTKNGVI